MAVGSYLARRIKAELLALERGEAAISKERLIEWLEASKGQFDASELAELEAALEVVGSGEPDFADLVPSGWFKELLEWTKQTESPSSFYFLAAACVIGGLIGRRICIDRGTYQIFPALSGLILSPAGRGRRSTACDLVVYGLGRPAGLTALADSFTYEAMGEALSELERPEALVYVGELSVLLGKGSYGESILPKLTDLIGKQSAFEWRTVKRGLVTFKDPSISMLATSAPDWLANNIPAVAFGGGFLSRFLVAAQTGPERTVAWGDALDAKQKERLIAHLKHMRTRFGKLSKPPKAALDWYTAWYMDHSGRIEKGEVIDEKLIPYLSRKHDHLLRLTTILTVAGEDEKLEFTVTRMEQALRLLNWYEGQLPLAYSNMALGPIGQAQQAVVRALERSNGMMDHSTLHKKVYRLAPLSGQFYEVIKSLLEMEIIQETSGLAKRGRVYILRKKLE